MTFEDVEDDLDPGALAAWLVSQAMALMLELWESDSVLAISQMGEDGVFQVQMEPCWREKLH